MQGLFENLLFYKNRNQYKTLIKNFSVFKSYKKGYERKNFLNKNIVTDKQKNYTEGNVTSC